MPPDETRSLHTGQAKSPVTSELITGAARSHAKDQSWLFRATPRTISSHLLPTDGSNYTARAR